MRHTTFQTVIGMSRRMRETWKIKLSLSTQARLPRCRAHPVHMDFASDFTIDPAFRAIKENFVTHSSRSRTAVAGGLDQATDGQPKIVRRRVQNISPSFRPPGSNPCAHARSLRESSAVAPCVSREALAVNPQIPGMQTERVDESPVRIDIRKTDVAALQLEVRIAPTCSRSGGCSRRRAFH